MSSGGDQKLMKENERLASENDGLRRALVRVLTIMLAEVCLASSSEKCRRCFAGSDGACPAVDAMKLCRETKTET